MDVSLAESIIDDLVRKHVSTLDPCPICKSKAHMFSQYDSIDKSMDVYIYCSDTDCGLNYDKDNITIKSTISTQLIFAFEDEVNEHMIEIVSKWNSISKKFVVII